MKNKTIMKKIICVMAAFLLSLFAIFESVLSITPYKAYAEDSATEEETTESKYTDVLEDLSKSPAFNVEDYPLNESDTSMTVIQIAESSDNELFLYVYQPSNTLTAARIRMSAKWEDGGYKDYPITLVSENGGLDKYVVDGFTLGTDTEDVKAGTHLLRTYKLTAILRPYVAEIDGAPTGDNTTTYTAITLNQVWTSHLFDGKLTYECEYLETISIEDRYTGFIRYLDGWFWYTKNTDSHYIAFRTDREIDTLLEADVEYTYRSASKSFLNGTAQTTQYGDLVDTVVNLTADDIFKKTATEVGADSYEYKRIQTVDEFLQKESEELTDETKQALEGMEWVLRFAETKYASSVYTGPYSVTQLITYTQVSNVSILRLRFEYDGTIYDLGAVDNVVTGSETPDNEDPYAPEVIIPKIDFSGIEEAFKKIMTVFGGIIIVALLGVIISVCAPVLGSAFKLLFKGLTWSLSLPFKLLDKLFKKK